MDVRDRADHACSWSSVVSALAPFVSALLHRIRLPQVVVLIVGGVLVGPEVLDLGRPGESSS